MNDKRTTGLYHKFHVSRTDGTSKPGQKHDGCEYFVLDVTHDKHAYAALKAYAHSCESEFPVLARDVRIQAQTQILSGLVRDRIEELDANGFGQKRAAWKHPNDLPDIEVVSARVHEAWIAAKAAQGVTSRKAEDDEELIAPYEQLSEKAKELDRGTVRAVYAAIQAASSPETPE